METKNPIRVRWVAAVLVTVVLIGLFPLGPLALVFDLWQLGDWPVIVTCFWPLVVPPFLAGLYTWLLTAGKGRGARTLLVAAAVVLTLVCFLVPWLYFFIRIGRAYS